MRCWLGCLILTSAVTTIGCKHTHKKSTEKSVVKVAMPVAETNLRTNPLNIDEQLKLDQANELKAVLECSKTANGQTNEVMKTPLTLDSGPTSIAFETPPLNPLKGDFCRIKIFGEAQLEEHKFPYQFYTDQEGLFYASDKQRVDQVENGRLELNLKLYKVHYNPNYERTEVAMTIKLPELGAHVSDEMVSVIHCSTGDTKVQGDIQRIADKGPEMYSVKFDLPNYEEHEGVRLDLSYLCDQIAIRYKDNDVTRNLPAPITIFPTSPQRVVIDGILDFASLAVSPPHP